MKYEYINQKFTQTVAEWLEKGYIINTASMNGSQGEIAKVDLTDGKEIVRVLIDRFHRFDRETLFDYDGFEVIVGRCTDNVKPNSAEDWNTVWNNNLEIIAREEFYDIGRGRGIRGSWFGSKEEADRQKKLQRERYDPRLYYNEVFTLGDEAKAKVLSFVNRQPGMKSVKIRDIGSVRKVITPGRTGQRHIYYEVEARNKVIRLH